MLYGRAVLPDAAGGRTGPHGARAGPAGTEVFAGVTRAGKTAVIDSQSPDIKEENRQAACGFGQKRRADACPRPVF